MKDRFDKSEWHMRPFGREQGLKTVLRGLKMRGIDSREVGGPLMAGLGKSVKVEDDQFKG